MKKVLFPDYNNGPANIANSILKHFKCTQFHPGNPIIDRILEEKNYQHVILYLSDGLGTQQLKEHLSEDSFLRKHHHSDFLSVFPPTTTASTTTYTTGLMPNEHGWLGWNMYIKEIDEIVTLFRNCIRDTYVPFEWTEDAAEQIYPNHYLHQIINEKGDGKGYFYFPFKWSIYKNKEELKTEVIKKCSSNEKNYLYLYDTQPDSLMHTNGSHPVEVTQKIQEINDWLEDISSELKDTLIIVTADHGHLDVKPLYLSEAEELVKMMIRPTSIETRASVFHIKEECRPFFKKTFYQYFSEDEFLVYSSDEIKEMKLFGTGENRAGFDDSIGDFIAISISDKMIVDSPDSFILKSHHAGLTEEEMIIPLILIECK